MPVHILKSGRAALEASRGSDTAPVRALYFDEGFPQQDVGTIRPQQIRNSFFGYYSAAVGPELNTFETSGAMSYDDLIWYANTHIKGVASGAPGTTNITSNSVANPTVVLTASAHNLTTGDSVVIAGNTGSTPSINGTYTATVTDGTHFTIPVNVTVGGSGGTVTRVHQIWTFTPTAASDDIKSASVQFGYSDGIAATQPIVKLNGLVGDEFSLKFDKSGDATVTFTSKMVSKSAAAQLSAFSGSAPDRTVVLASSVNTTAYLDTASAIGTTADSNVMDVTWSLKNGFAPLYTLNASTAPTDLLRTGARTWKAEITRAYAQYSSLAADAEWDAYVAKTVRKLRLKTVGPTLGSSTYIIQLDLYGVYTAMTNAEANGIAVQKFTMEPVYDTSATTDFSLVVTNNTPSIT